MYSYCTIIRSCIMIEIIKSTVLHVPLYYAFNWNEKSYWQYSYCKYYSYVDTLKIILNT